MDRTLPRIGFGTWQHDDHEVCVESVATALEVGYRHVDTAQGYENEDAVGDGIERSPVDAEDVFLATKLSTSNLGYEDAIETAEESRRRLGVEAIDLLYVHWPIDTYDPAETLPALAELYDRGVIRSAGLSNFTPDLLEAALDRLEVPMVAHQVECHPLLPQRELRSLADDYDHRLVGYSPLARGEVLDDPTIRDVAAEYGVSPAQVALAWGIEKDVVPIPKATGREHIEDNYAALDVSLDDAAIERLDDIERTERMVDFEAAPWH